jgi:hypothetical protein
VILPPATARVASIFHDGDGKKRVYGRFKDDRGTKSKPIPRPHLVYGFLTTAPNAVVEPIHPKAMPVILTTDEDDVLDRLSHRPGRVNDTLQMPNISFGYP